MQILLVVDIAGVKWFEAEWLLGLNRTASLFGRPKPMFSITPSLKTPQIECCPFPFSTAHTENWSNTGHTIQVCQADPLHPGYSQARTASLSASAFCKMCYSSMCAVEMWAAVAEPEHKAVLSQHPVASHHSYSLSCATVEDRGWVVSDKQASPRQKGLLDSRVINLNGRCRAQHETETHCKITL